MLNDNTRVSIKVFDSIGNEIVEIYNDKVESGKTYEIDFNGSNLSSGVYFYSMISAERKITKKMLLIK
jgi:hypothetical protein